MKLVVASGKGGVGKTTLSASLASRLGVTVIDADVDCPNMHLLFSGTTLTEKKVKVSKTAVIDEKKCKKCGKCDLCVFGALDYGDGPKIDPILCEGCGACAVVCPFDAITLREEESGKVVVTETEKFKLIHGELEPGKSGSGKIVFELKQLAGEKDLLIDAPAGIDCPTIAALTNTDHVIVVIEPTPASISDGKKLMEVASHFGVPCSVLLNKTGLSRENEDRIREFSGDSLIGEIPYDKNVPRAIAKLVPPVDSDGPAAQALEKVCEKVRGMFVE